MLVCQLEIPIETTLEAFRVAKSGNVRTILNPAPAAALPDELLQLADICAPNETETELLTGLPVGTAEEAERAARALLDRGPKVVILTLGSVGACGGGPGGVRGRACAARGRGPIPMGAGDAFIGSLAVFLGEGLPMAAAVQRANAVAVLSVTQIGTQISFPRRDAADAFLAERVVSCEL